jgi:hypothetical protein
MVGADIPNADVIGHDDNNVRLFGLRRRRRRESCAQDHEEHRNSHAKSFNKSHEQPPFLTERTNDACRTGISG